MSGFTELSKVLRDWPDVPVPVSPMSENCCERLRRALLQLREHPERVGAGDLAGLIRHVLRYEDLSRGGTNQLRVPGGEDWPRRELWGASGVSAVLDGGSFSISAAPWRPDWLPLSEQHPPLEASFREDMRRHTHRVPAEPCLPKVLGSAFSCYTSPGQRQAIRSVFFSRPGATVIINLPTGDGKSLVAWAPALFYRDQRSLTLVVVPTIALAIDQQEQYRRLGRTSHLTAFHSGLTSEDRNQIKQRIRDGTQEILFTSPESVVGSLAYALYEAAQQGYMRYFVIDEAHLVAQWGNEFRPEFQALAGIRKDLLQTCPSDQMFRTLLMSATLTQEAYNTLSVLFGPSESMEVVSAVHLRPEPEYWVNHADDEMERASRVQELVRHAPRPFLLYVSTKDQADEWLRKLNSAAIRRIGCVHGGTPTSKRSSIIGAWRRNEIDAVVATSAFGLGMDKADVRTVIHACVPETVDRYYQEVGRGGRDGKACVSLLIHTDKDRDIARALNSERIITVNRGLERWKSMLDDSRCEDKGNGLFKVSLKAMPPDIRQDSRGNEAWNLRTLTLMARSKLIGIESEKPPVIEERERESEDQYRQRVEDTLAKYYTSILVRVHSPRHQDQEHWVTCVEPVRKRTNQENKANLEHMEEVLRGDREISDILNSVYKSNFNGEEIDVVCCCGGCGFCRRACDPLLDYVPPESSPISHPDDTVPEPFKDALSALGMTASFVPVSYSPPGLNARSLKRWRKEIISLLKMLVRTGGIKEISADDIWLELPDYRELFRSSSLQFIIHRNIREPDDLTPLRVPRVSILDPTVPPTPIPKHLFIMQRPLHILLAPEDTPASMSHRKYFDVATHVTLESLKRGIDR